MLNDRDFHKNQESVKSAVFIGNYLPRQCGIATFTTDLSESFASIAPDISNWVIAINDKPEGYQYSSRVRFEINQDRLHDYDIAAEFLNMNHVDVVCLQHEYGIFGGRNGGYILELLRDIRIPVITTLHTILKNPSRQEREIMRQLSELSDRLVVMSHRSVNFLRDIYETPEQKIRLIPHGIPKMPLTSPDIYKSKFGMENKTVILSFGLLSPSKGLEYIIKALPAIVKNHPDVVYMVIGATHPHLKIAQGEGYRLSLHHLAKELGVSDHVVFHDRFVNLEDLIDFIGSADIYVTPYLNEEQIVSGTLAYTLGVGKAVVSTPYWYAQEMLADGRGRLVPFRDSHALANEINFLLDNPEERNAMCKRAYQHCRNMVWEEVAKQYLHLFTQAKQTRLRAQVPVTKLKTLSAGRQRLPEIRLDHLRVMTDDTGILQHARFTIPNRDHGYCVDDNSRALIVTIMADNLLPQEPHAKSLSSIYLSFLDHAFDEKTGKFRNFMTYDREWVADDNWEDAHGRAVWSLGVTVAGQDKGLAASALYLFHHSLIALEDLVHPRAMAFSIIGIHAYLGVYSGDSNVRRIRGVLSRKLMEKFRENAKTDWPWFEDILSYGNARIPHALILSGQWMQDNEMLTTGLRALKWLKEIQSDNESGAFSPIGNSEWYRRGGVKSKYDQQPIEASAMIYACIEAFNCTRDHEWIRFAYKCLDWYLGANDLNVSLYDHSTGGCRDGLEPHGVNENQGAESTLCWLLSLIALYNHRGAEDRTEESKREKESSEQTPLTKSKKTP